MARAARRLVLKRDGYRCTRCGATEDLQVHHVVPRHLEGTNDLVNLTTLCEACHLELHQSEEVRVAESRNDAGESAI